MYVWLNRSAGKVGSHVTVSVFSPASVLKRYIYTLSPSWPVWDWVGRFDADIRSTQNAFPLCP